MTTKKEAKELIKSWCKVQGMECLGIRHIDRQAYVIGKAAASCLIVQRSPLEAEKHLLLDTFLYPFDIIRTFDRSLKAGDFCITGYIRSKHCGDTIAIPFIKKQEVK